MNKKLLIVLLLIPILCIAQDRGHGGRGGHFKGFRGKSNSKNYFKGNIVGKVFDSKTGKPLEFANISLNNIRWDKIVEGTITDENGKFSMNQIRPGKYQINVSYIGYDKKLIDFELTKKKPDVRLKDILLIANSEMLSEVKIEEEKPIYESKIDKIIYNAENDVNEGLNDATDILRKAPLLSVDFEGNVELRGSKNIKFLLNGKASTFLTGDLATALSMIPADEIKSVEIITSPGAKYDGEGDAGIVNIVTKRTVIDGYKATIDGSVGSRVNRNSYNVTLGKGRFNLSARGSVHYSWPREGILNYERKDWDSDGDTNILTNNGVSESQWIGYRGGTNLYYDINAYNSIASDISFSGRNTPSENSTAYNYIGDTLEYSYNSNVKSTRDMKRMEWTTDYTKTFDNEDKELSISLQIGAKFNDEDTDISEQNGLIQLKNINDEKNIEETFQIDYTHPINSHKIEIGGKAINRDQEMQYTTTSEDPSYVLSTEVFNYNQIVAATYLSTQWQLPNDFGLMSGVRYELTQIAGNWENESQKEFSESYTNILPSFTLSKTFDMGKDLKLSYSNRISRPSSQYINTNTNRTDNKNIKVGNPDLTPSTTQQVELGYNSFGKKYQGSYYVYYKQSRDLIESFVTLRNDTSITTYENIGQNNRYGFNYYGSIRFDKLTFRGGFNLSRYEASDKALTSKENSAMLYNYNFGGTFDLGKDWKAEAFGFYRGRNQTLQGSSTSFSMMSFGVKKTFRNKRGSLGIRIIEPFLKDGYKVFSTDINGENFIQNSESKILFTSIGVSFKYTFGKLNFKDPSKKSNIRNDDVQEESNGEY
ncbi:MAG TPA: outer membrane beta-barrel family protein [Flavobacteriales bacterium]|jgi:outer membrane receptor protein involved in Fe transport|nr:outer membrane beta-barrel family protein [Flavobacteriales bacterium]